MKIGLYHGYELTGSGSNEYTRYLARSLHGLGHEAHILCREPHPETIPYITQAIRWHEDGTCTTVFCHETQQPGCVIHQLPHSDVRPVYLTDKQREGNVKSFIALSDDELARYHQLNERVLLQILSSWQLDALHANHLVYQPVAALNPCQHTQTPLIIFPHGSAIEYTIRRDERYRRLALQSLLACAGLIIGNREVRDRILNLYPEHRDALQSKIRIVGVGVDTSLFKPVERSERPHSIQHLLSQKHEGGKTPALRDELHQRLRQGDILATQEYWTRYDHALPDTDLKEQLACIPWQQKILLFVGALTVGKGVQSVIAAFPKVLLAHPDLHFVIVGAGAYREVLEALVYAISTGNRDLIFELCTHGQDLDRNELTGGWDDVTCFLDNEVNLSLILKEGRRLAQHVHFLGRLDHARLRYLFPCADIAIFPSVIPEAYPLVVMESLSNGVLPLVSYFSGFRDSVDELRPFLGDTLTELIKIPVEPPLRIKTIGEHLCQVLSNPSLQSIRPTLRQIAVEQFDWQLRAVQMATAYQAFSHHYWSNTSEPPTS